MKLLPTHFLLLMFLSDDQDDEFHCQKWLSKRGEKMKKVAKARKNSTRHTKREIHGQKIRAEYLFMPIHIPIWNTYES